MAPAVQVLEDRVLLSVSRLSPEVNVSQAAGTQGEVGIAANPNNPLNLVTVANNNSDISRLGAWYSFDGGANWTASFIDENQDGFGGGDSRFDPNVHFDSDGNVYVVYSTTGTGNRLLVARSADGGQNFNQVTTVTTDAGPNDLHTAMVTSRDDPNGADDIFVAWSRPQAGGESIEASLSLDAGATWGVTNSMVNDALQRTFLPWASVDNSGDFHVSWEVNTGGGAGFIFHDVLDGTTLVDGVDTSVTSVQITDFAAATSKIPAQPDRGLFSVTSLEVDRSGNGFDGRVYLAYSDRANTATNDIDIFLRYSDDNGATWSGPIQINDDTTTTSQFMPRMVLDQVTGTLFAAWYDARNDTANNQVVDVYMSTSQNGGLSWSTNKQLTEAVSNESVTNAARNTNNYTEYFGMSAIGGYAFTAWTDARAANFTAGLNEEVYMVGVKLLEPDEFEPNSTIETATVLGSLPKITLRDLTIHDSSDVDVYKITAQDTGKLIVNAFFDDFDGDINIRVLDMNGNNITPAGQGNSTTDNEKIVIPVVTQEMYFLEVVGNDGDHNIYDLEIENFPAPVPSGIHLDPASDSGMMANDNYTADDMPRLFIQADLTDFVAMGITPLSPANAALGLPGAAVEVSLVNTTTGIPVTGFANTVSGHSLWSFVPSAPLDDAVYFVRSAVRIFDAQRDEDGLATPPDFPVNGRSQYSEPLWMTVDTEDPAASLPDLLASSDTGMSDMDNVTNKMSPAFDGTAEANAKVRVLANGVVVGQGVVGSDASDDNLGNGLGRWEVTVEPLDDGMYSITVEIEDLAGNISMAGAPLIVFIDATEPNTPFLDLVESDDTGMMNDDNITSVNTPTITVTANDTVNGGANPMPNDVKYRIYDRPGNGGGEVLLIDSFAAIPGFTTGGFFTHTLTSVLNNPAGAPLADGIHNLKLEVEDRAGNISHDFLLNLVIDTTVPKGMVEEVFRAELTGSQEVGPVVTTAFGDAMFLLNPAQDRLEMTIELIGLDLDGLRTPLDPSDDVTGLHIHNAPAGANGGVVFGIIGINSDLNGDTIVDAANGRVYSAWDLNEGNGGMLAGQLANLRNGDLYVNVHTVGNPGGEIRGQIQAAGGAVRLVPSSDSGMSVIDNVTNKMSPAFTGWGEANAKVRVFAKNVETGSVSLVGQGVVGTDGTDGVIDNGKGVWEVTVEPMVDGAYEITVEYEDLAGNITSAYSFVGVGGPITDDMQPNDFTQDVAHLFGNIMDIDVKLDIDHPAVDQLDIFLIAPDGTQVELVTDVTNGGANFTGTIFDDEAAGSINLGVASYTGRFQPEGLLSALDGKDPNGEWTLRITDDTGQEGVGELLSWELCIKTDAGLPIWIDTEEPNTPFLDLVDESDTGMMNDDNITADDTPDVTVTVNDTVDGNGNPFWHDVKYRIYDRPGDGSGEVLLVDSYLGIPGFTEEGFFEHTLTSVLNDPNGPPLADGVHNLKLEVEDRAGNISHDFLLTIVIDTVVPKAMVEEVFRAELDGGQEVPPVMTTAFGDAMFLLNPAEDRLEITIELLGLDLDGLRTPLDPSDDVTGLHIHNAIAGMNGPIVFGLLGINNDLNGDLIIDDANSRVYSAWDLNEGQGTTLAAQLANLRNGELYVNVHTNGNPGGEIRGQILAAGGAVRLVPSSDTGMSVIDNVTNKMSPAFTGWAEANAKVRVFAKNLETGSVSLVGQGLVGSDGTDGVIGNNKGFWEVTVEPMADGAYEITIEHEDLAGNISSAYSFLGDGGAITDDQQPNDFTQDVAHLFGNIMDIDVRIDIEHPAVDQLDIFLIGPDGTSMELVTDVANDGANFFGTVFDDEAAASINTGVASYKGRFQPEESLGDQWALTDPNGQWTLRITDDTGGDVGELLGWELCIKTDAGLPIWIDTAVPNTPYLDLVETSDTGRHSADNITSDNTPTVTIVADDTIDGDGNPFWHDIKYRIYDRPGDGSGEVLIVDSYASIPGFSEDGFFTETLGRVLNNPEGLPLNDGVHNLKLEVEDRAGNISPDFLLQVVIDTHKPSTFFGLPELAYDGLDHSSDSDVDVDPPTNSDRVTNDTTPTFFGTAEADSIIKVYVVDGNGNQVLIGQTVAVPLDGNQAYPGGRWEVTSALDLNDPSLGFARDGLRQIEVVGEDVAGNISYGQADVTFFGDQVHDLLPPFGPNSIPDGGNLGIPFSSSGIAGRIIDIDVKLSIEHTNVEDLDVTLSHNDTATIIDLFSDVGGDGNHFINTVLDDEATTAITAGVAPFTGSFIPEELLAAFDGLDADSQWVIFISDDTVNAEVGSVFAYDFAVCVKLSPLEIFLDTQGPRVYDPDAGGPDQPIQVISDGLLDTEFNIFDIKPTTGPTPRVDGLRINIEDLPFRFVDPSPEFALAGVVTAATNATPIVITTVDHGLQTGDIVEVSGVTGNTAANGVFSVKKLDDNTFELVGSSGNGAYGGGGAWNTLAFPYQAIAENLALEGHIMITGDRVGNVAFKSITFTPDPDPPLHGESAKGYITIEFYEPLEDDRFTLTIKDSVVDPANNAFDGESNAQEPFDNPLFPSGDGIAGGNFVSRFTVDTRDEIGVFGQAGIFIDANGNYVFNPPINGGVNHDVVRDLVFDVGIQTDHIFAGEFKAPNQASVNGYDRIGAYGQIGGVFRFLLDIDDDGVVDLNFASNLQINALPIAGNFDGNAANGDEIGLFDGTSWFLDTTGNNVLDTTVTGTLRGLPIVGDFDGDGIEDLGTFDAGIDLFRLSLSSQGGGFTNALTTTTFIFGFPGVNERPAAGQLDADAADDIALTVPDQNGAVGQKEWYILLTGDPEKREEIPDNRDDAGDAGVAFNGGLYQQFIDNLIDPFSPTPVGDDYFTIFGDNQSVPIIGNFDPPTGKEESETPSTMAETAYDLDQSLGLVANSTYNWGGAKEKWLGSASGTWYFITEDGKLYKWTSSKPGGDFVSGSQLVATFDADYYNDPSMLTEAQNPAGGGGEEGGGTIDPLEQAAYNLDQSLGLEANATYNWGGANEKWLGSASGTWYFLTEDGSLYKWTGSSPGAGFVSGSQLVAIFDAGYYADLSKLTEAPVPTAGGGGEEGGGIDPLVQAAYDLDQSLGLIANATYNWGGAKEKWLGSASGVWYFLTEDGSLYKWIGSKPGADFVSGSQLVATLDASYYADPSKLFDAKLTNALDDVFADPDGLLV